MRYPGDMASTAIASLADAQERLGRDIDSDESSRLEALLLDASETVRAYCGQGFTLGERILKARMYQASLKLSQYPVLGVTSVKDNDNVDITYQFDGIDTVSISRGLCLYIGSSPLVVNIKYQAGFSPEDMPRGLIAVVCQVAIRAFGMNAEKAGLQTEVISSYNYSMGAAGAAGPMGLLPAEANALKPFRGRQGGVIYQ